MIYLFDDQISLQDNQINHSLYLCCPGCENKDCYFDCDGSHTLPFSLQETEEDARQRLQYNAFIDGVTSLLLCLHTEGIDVSKFDKSVRESIEAGENNIIG